MTSTKGVLLAAMGRLVLREARVAEVREVSAHVRRIVISGDGLLDVVWRAGDKIQVLLPTRDVRTYTPAAWDADQGTTELLVFDHGDHGDSPGAVWGRRVRAGDACRFVGPQRSLGRSRGRAGVVFGDETSYAVALAMARAVPSAPLVCVLEVGDRAEGEAVVAAIGLGDRAQVAVIERSANDAHLAEVATELARGLRAHPGAELLLTGRAQSIQAVRARLRAAGVGDRAANKAYWAPGKTGLD
jgi:NADPH-dependent ferric siderophore reductase